MITVHVHQIEIKSHNPVLVTIVLTTFELQFELD